MNTSGHSSAEWPGASQRAHQRSTTAGAGSSNHLRNSSSPPGTRSGATPQEWCLHAQLTISHPKSEPVRTTYVARGIGGGGTLPKDKWTTTGSNIQFQYSWSNCDKETVTEVVPEESGIQKFESWPRGQKFGGGRGAGDAAFQAHNQPQQQQQQQRGWGQSGKKVGDSGYSTEQNFGAGLPGAGGFQKEPGATSSFKARVIQPYGRRCISTCTITLSNDPEVTDKIGGEFGGAGSKYSFSTENLNFQATPQQQQKPAAPVIISRIAVKDAETQTVPTAAPVKSPPPPPTPPKKGSFLHTKNDFTSITVNPDTSNVTVLNNQVRQDAQLGASKAYHKESFKSVQIKGSSPPQHHHSRQSFRTPAQPKENGASAAVRRAKSSPPIRFQQKTNQPRTVHIDVYCTGSSADETGTTTTTTTDEDNHSTASTPQTVYNTTQYKIQHQRHKSGYPQHYPQQGSGQEDHVDRKRVQSPPTPPPQETQQPARKKGEEEILNNLASLKSKTFLEEPTDFLALRKNLSGESCETGSVLSSTYPSSYHSEAKDDSRLSRDSTASSFSFASGGYGYEQQSEGSSWKESKMTGGGSVMSASYHFDGKRVEDVDRHSDLEESLVVGNGAGGEGVNDQWWLQYLFSKFDVKGNKSKGMNLIIN